MLYCKKNLLKRLGILGCGWLGTELAQRINSKSWNVKVTRTSEKGIIALTEKGFNSFQIEVTENSIKGDLKFFENLDQLIISIPPKRNEAKDYSRKINYLMNFLELKNKCRVIFLSSTSVYGKKEGVFDETSALSPETESSRELVESEKLILESDRPSIILRLGGLVGKDRNPIFQLHKKIIPNPDGIINFVDQKDAVEGIYKLLTTPTVEGVFNLVSPHHPKRRDYYLKMAKKYKLSVPVFSEQNPILMHQIEAVKIQQKTGFKYQVNNLLI